MTSKAALAKYLLAGNVVNIKKAFTLFGITNCPREISRSIEQAFGVVVSRVNMEGKSRYGQTCRWVDYRLNKTAHNAEGIKKMIAYVESQLNPNPKTDKEKKEVDEVKELQAFADDYFSGKLDPPDPAPKPSITQPELFQ